MQKITTQSLRNLLIDFSLTCVESLQDFSRIFSCVLTAFLETLEFIRHHPVDFGILSLYRVGDVWFRGSSEIGKMRNGMKLSYCVVDRAGQLRRGSRRLVEALWHGDCTAAELGIPIGETLRLITVLSDPDLLPIVVYFIRLDIEDGAITEDSRVNAFEAMTSHRRRRYDHSAAQRQFIGWPSDWQTQLAIALDVPANILNKLGVGGPLLLADLWGVPLEKVLSYFEDATDR